MVFEDDYSPAMTHWFGTPWPFPHLPAPVCAEQRFRIDVPVGESCLGCDEPITADDSGVRMPYYDGKNTGWGYYHAECNLRTVMCPYCMGILTGGHPKDGGNRREEGRLLLAWSRDNTFR